MKKIFSILTIVSLFAIFLAPVASAQETAPTQATSCNLTHDFSGSDWSSKYGISCPDSGACDFSNTTYTCGTCCLMNTIYTITDWIFVLIVILVVIFVLLGAFNILTAGGSPEKVNAGRSYIIYAVVGLIIAMIAKVIPLVARSIVGI